MIIMIFHICKNHNSMIKFNLKFPFEHVVSNTCLYNHDNVSDNMTKSISIYLIH